jgi:hypothetical protein
LIRVQAGQNVTLPKKRKRKKYHVRRALWRAGGFSRSLNVPLKNVVFDIYKKFLIFVIITGSGFSKVPGSGSRLGETDPKQWT